MIRVYWRQTQQDFTLDLTVPVTATALVYLPRSSPDRVTESGHPVAEAAGVTWLRQAGKTAVLQVASDTYHFQVSL